MPITLSILVPNIIHIQVSDQPLASGGEGSIHEILSPPYLNGKCVKLYFPQYRTDEKERKIAYMVSTPPASMNALHTSGFMVCWPEAVVYEGGDFVGFVMPLASAGSEQLYELCRMSVAPQLPQQWLKYDRSLPDGVRSRLKLCVNIASATHAIHSLGRYVLVDFKPENILVTHGGSVSLIDLDSIQIADQGQMLFPAQVLTQEYAQAESHNISKGTTIIDEAWDRFSLAVIFYELLFGIHPYTASYKAPYDNITTAADSIYNGLFVFGLGQYYLHTKAFIHDNYLSLPQNIQGLFLRAFNVGTSTISQRPTAHEWGQTIYREINTVAQHRGFLGYPTPPTSPKPSVSSQPPSSGSGAVKIGQIAGIPPHSHPQRTYLAPVVFLMAILVIIVSVVSLISRKRESINQPISTFTPTSAVLSSPSGSPATTAPIVSVAPELSRPTSTPVISLKPSPSPTISIVAEVETAFEKKAIVVTPTPQITLSTPSPTNTALNTPEVSTRDESAMRDVPSPTPTITPRPVAIYQGPQNGTFNVSVNLEKEGILRVPMRAPSGIRIRVDSIEPQGLFSVEEPPMPRNNFQYISIRSKKKVNVVVTIHWSILGN